MFLKSLNNKQKELFMKLAIKAAEVNGVVEVEEKNMLKNFAIEMDIEPRYSTDTSLDEILNAIVENSTEKELKIFTFEILGILISDSEFDDEEKKFVDDMIKRFNVSRENTDEMLDSLYEYLNIYKRITKLIL